VLASPSPPPSPAAPTAPRPSTRPWRRRA
jgi:hypothetical protein